MTEFTKHDENTAPEGSKALLAKSKAAFGRIPGLHATMAEAPGLLEAYQVAHQLFAATSFDKDEITVVWQTINVENGCGYCVPAHTGIAKAMGVDDAITEALRNEAPLPNARLEALRDFTLLIVRDRGHVDDAAVKAFLTPVSPSATFLRSFWVTPKRSCRTTPTTWPKRLWMPRLKNFLGPKPAKNMGRLFL